MSDYYSFTTIPILDSGDEIKEITNYLNTQVSETHFNYSVTKVSRWTVISGISKNWPEELSNCPHINYFIYIDEVGKIVKEII